MALSVLTDVGEISCLVCLEFLTPLRIKSRLLARHFPILLLLVQTFGLLWTCSTSTPTPLAVVRGAETP